MAAQAPERLLNAAQAEVIAQDGRLEMSAVARRAGVSVGLAYHHFGSKTGLIAALVERFYGPLREVMMGPSGATREEWRRAERDRLRRLIDYYYDHPLAPLLVGRLGREPEVLDLERTESDALLTEGARNLAAAQANGVISREIDPEIAIGLVLGGALQSLKSALHATPRPPRARLHAKLWILIEGALGLHDQTLEGKKP